MTSSATEQSSKLAGSTAGEQLRPCPFCGCPVEYRPSHVAGEKGHIGCTPCSYMFDEFYHETKEQLFAAWNTRIKGTEEEAYSAGWQEGIRKGATIAANMPSLKKISEKHVKAVTPKDVAKKILKILEK